MAVDPKTGKPLPYYVPPPADSLAFAEYLTAVGFITETEFALVADDFARAEADDADPRGVSALRGAYGPWLAAQESRKAAEGRP